MQSCKYIVKLPGLKGKSFQSSEVDFCFEVNLISATVASDNRDDRKQKINPMSTAGSRIEMKERTQQLNQTSTAGSRIEMTENRI